MTKGRFITMTAVAAGLVLISKLAGKIADQLPLDAREPLEEMVKEPVTRITVGLLPIYMHQLHYVHHDQSAAELDRDFSRKALHPGVHYAFAPVEHIAYSDFRSAIDGVLNYSLNHANETDPYPPAGQNRGGITLNVYNVPRALRDVLYDHGVNPIIMQAGAANMATNPVIWGQKFIAMDGSIDRMVNSDNEMNPKLLELIGLDTEKRWPEINARLNGHVLPTFSSYGD